MPGSRLMRMKSASDTRRSSRLRSASVAVLRKARASIAGLTIDVASGAGASAPRAAAAGSAASSAAHILAECPIAAPPGLSGR